MLDGLVQHNLKLAYLKLKKEITKLCCLVLFLVYAKCSEKEVSVESTCMLWISICSEKLSESYL